MEGYVITGNSSTATFEGVFEANSFREACDQAFNDEKHKGYYDRERLTYWGCGLYDNHTDAAKAFG
jgi:hypothetical protein